MNGTCIGYVHFISVYLFMYINPQVWIIKGKKYNVARGAKHFLTIHSKTK